MPLSYDIISYDASQVRSLNIVYTNTENVSSSMHKTKDTNDIKACHICPDV